MSHQSLNRIFLALAGVLLAVLIFFAAIVHKGTRDKADWAQTATVLREIARVVEESPPPAPKDQKALFTSLRSAGINWRRCQLRDSSLTDAFGESVELRYDPTGAEWLFLSKGPDRVAGTRDDMMVEARLQK